MTCVVETALLHNPEVCHSVSHIIHNVKLPVETVCLTFVGHVLH